MYLDPRIKVAEILMIFIKYQSPAIEMKKMVGHRGSVYENLRHYLLLSGAYQEAR